MTEFESALSPVQLPSSVLRAEHKVILRVLGVLERLTGRSKGGKGFEADSLRQCVDFFRLFADACHHAKEEDLLFPVLEARGIPCRGGPIGVMLYEHRLARRYTQEMDVALEDVARGVPNADRRFHDVADAYLDLLKNHIFKEDNVLFKMGDQVMTGEDQRSLSAKFCEAGCRAFSGRTRDQLEEMANELEARWPAG